MEFDAQHGPLVELRATLLALGLCSPAAADCHMALLLALDVSSSIDADEYVPQWDGVAAALEAPEVAKSILGHGGRSIALAVDDPQLSDFSDSDWARAWTRCGAFAKCAGLQATRH